MLKPTFDCFVSMTFFNNTKYALFSVSVTAIYLLKRYIEEKHGMPFLKIETDYSPSDIGQLRLRIESFLSLIESRL